MQKLINQASSLQDIDKLLYITCTYNRHMVSVFIQKSRQQRRTEQLLIVIDYVIPYIRILPKTNRHQIQAYFFDSVVVRPIINANRGRKITCQ